MHPRIINPHCFSCNATIERVPAAGRIQSDQTHNEQILLNFDSDLNLRSHLHHDGIERYGPVVPVSETRFILFSPNLHRDQTFHILDLSQSEFKPILIPKTDALRSIFEFDSKGDTIFWRMVNDVGCWDFDF